MRGCEADRCDAGATVDGRWCERHAPADEHVHRLIQVSRVLAMTDDERRIERLTLDYLGASEKIAELEEQLSDWRGMRVLVLRNMRRTGMSLGDIAKVTGLTRQRIGQLLKDMP